MRKQTYVVKLSKAKRERLNDLISKGKSSARVQLRARILLHADTGKHGSGWNDAQISEALGTYPVMCFRVRRSFVTEGLDAVLTRKKRETPPIAPIFDGEKQAQLIALACTEPPAGFARWTIRLLAEAVVERQIVPAAHHNTIARALKKTNSSRT